MEQVMVENTHKIRLHLSHRRLEGDCPECGFESMVNISGIELQPTGVKIWFDKTYCGRCKDIAKGQR